MNAPLRVSSAAVHRASRFRRVRGISRLIIGGDRGTLAVMKVAPSHMTLGPVRALPRAAEQTELPVTDLGSALVRHGLSLRASAAPCDGGADWIGTSCEGVATLLEAAGEHGPWLYPVAGSTIGLAMGVIGVVGACRDGNADGVRAGWMKIGAGGLGVIAGSGLLHAYPSVQAAVEMARTVLGCATPPERQSVLTTYGGIGAVSLRR